MRATCDATRRRSETPAALGSIPSGVEQPEIDVDDVARFARRVHARRRRDRARRCRRQPRQRFARVLAVEPDDPRRARQPRDDRGLDQPLQIDRDVVARLSDAANRARAATRRPPAPLRSLIARRRSIGGHEIEDLAVLAADQPVDPRRRKRATKRGGHRNGVHDVAERAEADDQETRQSRTSGDARDEIARRVRFLDRRQSPCARRTTGRRRAREPMSTV